MLQIFKPAGEEKLIEQTLNEINQKYLGFLRKFCIRTFRLWN